MRKSPSFETGLKKGPWTSDEDRKLVTFIQEHGHGSWRTLPLKAGLQRCGKSCRLRWTNYLRPDIKRGKFSLQEEQTIMQLHALLGNKWSAIASHLPRRTDNEIKNYWNTNIKKQLTKLGIDPVTHKSRIASASNLSHMTQWENARLEAEARLVHESRLISEPLVQPFSRPQPLCFDVLKAWKGIVLSKQSDLKGLKPPLSTLNFFEKALSSLSNINNRSTPALNPTENVKASSNMNMSIKDSKDGWENLKEPFNILEISKEETTLNMLEDNDILYHDLYMMEALTHPLVDDTHNQGDDFKDKNDYWSQIIDELAE